MYLQLPTKSRRARLDTIGGNWSKVHPCGELSDAELGWGKLHCCHLLTKPSSGLKQLITEVQQQVLTGHAQKNRADSEENTSSHHPLTQTYFRALQVRSRTVSIPVVSNG
ncbi:hypothetical protein INR49_013557 [Caranx melampygus]|nr:hypothetical protein INR49_013557 [Caranx melampygus]